MRATLPVCCLLFIILFFVGCTSSSLSTKLQSVHSSSAVSDASITFVKGEYTLISPNGVELPLTLELAETDAEHASGLMFRKHLDPNAGMLFTFQEQRVLYFWMKNTFIPLDVLFFDVQGRFISSSTMTPCVADPCVTYPSDGLATYALEVNAGYAKEHGVGAGWQLHE